MTSPVPGDLGAPGTPPDVPADWSVGERVTDLYEVRTVYGHGAMGVVYRVRHLGWETDLAVKSPRPEYFQSDADRERFVREAETWVSLGLHPHVCACHYVRTLGGIPRVFAEYVEHGSLREWIDDGRLYEGGPQDALTRILDFGIQTAWGLEHAHSHGVVHQDVKPANILIDAEGTAKVTDFGLSRAHGPDAAGAGQARAQDRSILVTTGGMTPAYASPEQQTGVPVGRRSDVYSLAVSILEMCTGEVTWMAGPVAGAALMEYRRLGAEANTPVGIPTALGELLERCLHEDPAQRPDGMGEVAERLAEIFQQVTGTPYERPRPKAADLRADELNNRALSLLDLGRTTEARTAFEEALASDPQHLEANYNYGLLLWRAGERHDDALVKSLESVLTDSGDSWQAQHLLARVHLERGDTEPARALAERAATQAPHDPQLQTDLRWAHSEGHTIGHTLCTLRRDTETPVPPSDLSADGRLAVSLDDRVVNVWDAHTGRYLHGLQHPQRVQAARLSADGHCLLSRSIDGNLRLWRTDTGLLLRTLLAYNGEGVDAFHLGDNGRFAVSVGSARTVRVWDMESGRYLHSQQGSLSCAGNSALTGEDNGTIRVWDLRTGRCPHSFGGLAKGEVVYLSPGGRFGLSCGVMGSGEARATARVWDVATGRVLSSFHVDVNYLLAGALSRDGQTALIGDYTGSVQVFEVATGHLRHTLRGHSQLQLEAIHLSPDGRLALTRGSDTSVRVWDVRNGRCLHTHKGCLAGDGSAPLTGDTQGRLRLWGLPEEPYLSPYHPCRPNSSATLTRLHARVETLVRDAHEAMTEGRFPTAQTALEEARRTPGWQRTRSVLDAWQRLALNSPRAGLRAAWPTRLLRGHGPDNLLMHSVWSVHLTPDGRLALSGGSDGTVRVWDPESGHLLHTLTHNQEDDDNRVQSVHLTPDGRLALSGGSDGTVRVWDPESGHLLHTLTHNQEDDGNRRVQSVHLTPDGRLALSGGVGGTARVWDLRTGRCLRTLEVPFDLRAIRVSADGRLALTAPAQQGVAQVWDLETGRLLRTLGHDLTENHRVNSADLTADGRLALSGGSDGTVRVWDPESGHLLHTLTHQRVTPVCLTPDGQLALSGGVGGTVRVWDLRTGRCLRTLETASPVLSVCLTPDGRLALSGAADGTVQVWELDWELAAREAANWDEGARPFLETFLTLRTPFAARVPTTGALSEEQTRLAMSRHGRPSWTEEDFAQLLQQLQYAGYGWLRPQGVRVELERMARDWQGPPPLLGA